MPRGYAPLPNPGSAPDAERELDAAFESDEEEDHTESTPLTHHNEHDANDFNDHPPVRAPEAPAPGMYDFEREYEYDRPPPGSPPRPSALALPNNYGNSNGAVPDSPVRTAPGPRRNIFARAMGAILPTHYARQAAPRGGGTENDGVFANVMAKPNRPRTVRTEDGDVHMVPEDQQNEAPPSYSVAQADAVPQYWETTVHAPGGLGMDGDMMVDDLPSGSLFVFAANLFTSFFFQFVGFLLTYLLHTSHAAKYGSRAGLGLTLIQYGFYSRVRGTGDDAPDVDEVLWGAAPAPTESLTGRDGDLASTSPAVPTDPGSPGEMMRGLTSREWLSFLLMTIGWFLLLSSCVGFWRIKRWEKSIRSANTAHAPVTRDDIERDIAVRRNLESVFGIGFIEDEREPPQSAPPTGNATQDQRARDLADEARLTRDLRAAGLL